MQKTTILNSGAVGANCSNAASGLAQTNSLVGAGPSLSQYFLAPQTLGNLNIVIVNWQGTTGSATVTDISGNSYLDVFGGPVSDGSQMTQYFYAANIAAASAGGNQVTTTLTLSTTITLEILEYSGVQKISPLDAQAQNTYTNSVAVNSGPITTMNNCDLIISTAIYEYTWNGNLTAGASFDFPVQGDMVESLTASSAGSYTLTSNQNFGGYATALAAAFKRDTAHLPAKGPIVQNSAVLLSGTSSVALPMPFAQSAGNMNAVVVAYGSSTITVTGVTDSLGNTYTKAMGPSAYNGLSLYIYYAPIVTGGSSNTVNVQTSSSVSFINTGVYEISGLSVNTLTGATAATGYGTVASTGTIALPSNTQFVMEVVETDTWSALPFLDSNFGFMFTFNDNGGTLGGSRWISNAGNYSSTSNLSGTANWIAAIVAFK